MARAPGLGPGDRRFESSHPDTTAVLKRVTVLGIGAEVDYNCLSAVKCLVMRP